MCVYFLHQGNAEPPAISTSTSTSPSTLPRPLLHGQPGLLHLSHYYMGTRHAGGMVACSHLSDASVSQIYYYASSSRASARSLYRVHHAALDQRARGVISSSHPLPCTSFLSLFCFSLCSLLRDHTLPFAPTCGGELDLHLGRVVSSLSSAAHERPLSTRVARPLHGARGSASSMRPFVLQPTVRRPTRSPPSPSCLTLSARLRESLSLLSRLFSLSSISGLATALPYFLSVGATEGQRGRRAPTRTHLLCSPLFSIHRLSLLGLSSHSLKLS